MSLTLLFAGSSSSSSGGGSIPVVAGSLSLVAASAQNLAALSSVSCNSKGSYTWVVRCKLTANGSYQSLMYLNHIAAFATVSEILVFPDNTVQFAINNTFNTSKAMVFGAFTVVIAEYDSGAGTMRLSLDNGTASSGSISAPAYNGDHVYIGARDSNALPANGLIDFCGVIGRTLTSGERAALCAGPLDYAHLDDAVKADAIWWMDFDTSGTLLVPAVGSETWTNNNSATWSSVNT